jgi:hypothetical protein
MIYYDWQTTTTTAKEVSSMQMNMMENYDQDPKLLEKFGRNLIEEVKKDVSILSLVEMMRLDVSLKYYLEKQKTTLY